MPVCFHQTARPLYAKKLLVSTESSVLHELIQLLYCTHTQYPEILEKININSNILWLTHNVKQKYLETYIDHPLLLPSLEPFQTID